MINPFSIMLIGFLLGMRHATDPDHVIAITTIVSRERRIGSALVIGALWGVGHSLTILLVGGAIILFHVAIPPRVGLSMEFSVALMLILLGAMNLTGALRWLSDRFSPSSHGGLHAHPHRHGDQVHLHPHRHNLGPNDHAEEDHAIGWGAWAVSRLGLFQTVRPLVVGVVHGLAGSAAIALLVLTTIPSPAWGIAYLLVFSLGTMGGMALITAANAAPFTLTAGRFTRANHYLGVASGLLSLGFGLFLAYQIGFVDGLFSGDARWTPR